MSFAENHNEEALVSVLLNFIDTWKVTHIRSPLIATVAISFDSLVSIVRLRLLLNFTYHPLHFQRNPVVENKKVRSLSSFFWHACAVVLFHSFRYNTGNNTCFPSFIDDQSIRFTIPRPLNTVSSSYAERVLKFAPLKYLRFLWY